MSGYLPLKYDDDDADDDDVHSEYYNII